MAVDTREFYVKISSPTVDISHSKTVQCITVDSNCSFRNVQRKVLEAIDIDSKSHVIKVRNSSGSVFTLTGKVPSNTSDQPYSVEVIPYYYHAQPLSFVQKDHLRLFINAKLKAFTNRIEALQDAIPDYLKSIEKTILRDLQQKLKPTLDFLENRLEQSKLASWEGKIKQSPLW